MAIVLVKHFIKRFKRVKKVRRIVQMVGLYWETGPSTGQVVSKGKLPVIHAQRIIQILQSGGLLSIERIYVVVKEICAMTFSMPEHAKGKMFL